MSLSLFKYNKFKITMKTSGGGRLIILTLKKHREGIWIRKLVERLESIKVQVAAEQNCDGNNHYQIEVRALEDWLATGWLVSDARNQQDNHSDIIGIVNRVSDAASPKLFKACCAILAAAEQSLRIPVWNGSKAYSLCGNKWMHHLLFRRANLSAPTTMSYWIGDSDGDDDNDDDREEEMTEEKTINIDTRIFRQDDITGTTKLLIKPNAGGFGTGIKKISIPPLPLPSSSPSGEDVIHTKQGLAKISIPSSYEDCMALVQQYEQPRDQKLHRVWFLNGKIQCAVERQIGEDDDAFTSGCASGCVCTLSDASSRRNKIIKQNNESSSSSSSISNQNNGIKYETTTSLSQELSNNHSAAASPSSESFHSSPSPSPPHMVAWKVPNEIRQEIEDRLLPLLEDAHSGSVEFLYTSLTLSNEKNATSKGSGSEEVLSSWPRLYFDLNLLSTLPVFDDDDDDEVTEKDGGGQFWFNDYEPGYDPWHELANSIWEFCITTSITKNTMIKKT
jgi:hypothetical protein